MGAPLKVVAALLILGGVLGLLYGGFSFVQTTHRADIGPMHLKVQQTEDVQVPIWLSLGAVIGGVLLLVTSRKR